MIRFLIGIHDRINDVVTGETTMRGYDKVTGELVETIKMIPKDKDKDEDKSVDG